MLQKIINIAEVVLWFGSIIQITGGEATFLTCVWFATSGLAMQGMAKHKGWIK